MATSRRQLLLLGVLVVILLGAIYRLLPGTSATPAASSNRQAAAGAPRPAQQPPNAAVPDVHLDALNAERPKPAEVDRDLFRFKPKAPPPSPVGPPRPGPTGPAVPVPIGPPPAPSLAPIPLKFIGIMGPANEKIAVLTDGRGGPVTGKEGDLVLGQYRILKIGVESVEIAYADGRGRQTIRLSGQ